MNSVEIELISDDIKRDQFKFDDCKSELSVDENVDSDFGMCFAKCGEILAANAGNFILVCIFCDEQFETLDPFQKHMKNKHFGNDVDGYQSDSNHSENNQSELSAGPLDPAELSDNKEKTIICHNSEETKSPVDRDFLKYFYNFVDECSVKKESVDVEDDYSDSDDLPEVTLDDFFNELPQVTPESPKTEHNENCVYPEAYCSLCSRQFRTIQGFLKHKVRHEVVSDEDVERNSKAKLYDKQRITSLKCKYCGKQFRDKERRLNHERTHTGELPFKCPQCPKRFRAQRFCDIHVRIHSEERPFKCIYCPAGFKHKMNLTVHIRAHLGEKRFQCDYCSKRFVRNVDKRIHMRSHTGEKPFQCEQCGMKFSTSSKLTEHRKRHSNTRPYECDICCKRFYSRGLLKNHAVSHSDERPFECEVCHETFPRKRALLSHVKIHSDTKEYICKLCGKAFAQNAGLYCHMRTHGFRLGTRYPEEQNFKFEEFN